MKIAASFLDIKEPKVEELTKLDSMDIDYIHLDVMDGIFVENKTYTYEEFYDITRFTIKPKDIHLMVSDVKKNIDEFSKMNPMFITFHYEAVSEVSSVINYIKELGIKVGMSIKPSTEVSEIIDYLETEEVSKYINNYISQFMEYNIGMSELPTLNTKEFNELIDTAVKDYEKKTGNDINEEELNNIII